MVMTIDADLLKICCLMGKRIFTDSLCTQIYNFPSLALGRYQVFPNERAQVQMSQLQSQLGGRPNGQSDDL